jgi:microcystin-dependent protein
VSEPYIAQVMIFAFNFAPRNWAFCSGALAAISQNTALFSIIGTTYGGDGVTTFALPNIQDSGIVSVGQGPGLSDYVIGQKAGTAQVTLNQGQIPAHTHQAYLYAASSQDLAPSPNGWFGNQAHTGKIFSDSSNIDQPFNQQALTISGSSLPHMNEQPYLGLNFCIALYGIFPSRN